MYYASLRRHHRVKTSILQTWFDTRARQIAWCRIIHRSQGRCARAARAAKEIRVAVSVR
jgi:hypothetical protein